MIRWLPVLMEESCQRQRVRRTTSSVQRWIGPRHLAASLGIGGRRLLKDADSRGIEAATGSPVAKPFDRFGRSRGYGNDVTRGLGQWEIQQRGETASSFDLRASPSLVIGQSLVAVEVELFQVEIPDRTPFARLRQVEKEHGIESLRARELRRQLRDVVAAMKLQQAILFERAAFQLPEHIGREATMPDERQAERRLGFKPGQSRELDVTRAEAPQSVTVTE